MNRILHTLLVGIALLAAACGPRESAEDRQAIQSLLQAQFDRADARLTVDPIAVSDDHAVAGWTQGDTGGRALLKKRHSGWALVLCAGTRCSTPASCRKPTCPAALPGNSHKGSPTPSRA